MLAPTHPEEVVWELWVTAGLEGLVTMMWLVLFEIELAEANDIRVPMKSI